MARPPQQENTEAAPRRWLLPAWLASLVIHLAAFVALGLIPQFRLTNGLFGDGSGPGASGELWLKLAGEQGSSYESDDDGNQGRAQQAISGPSLDSVLGSLDSVPGTVVSLQPGVALGGGPGSGKTAAGSSSGAGGGMELGGSGRGAGSGGAGALTKGASPHRYGGGGGTNLSFMNIDSQGNNFVFVIDRSASMSQSGRLAAAKAELRGALKMLDKTNQFQIIFYNEKTELFRPTGNRSFVADDATKSLAERFVEGITADGASEGFAPALRMAVHYHPDVIYFLTDAEDISLSDVELAGISRSSYGTTIHTIKFGEGAEERIPWMVKLASQNAGKYVYVDSRGFSGRK